MCNKTYPTKPEEAHEPPSNACNASDELLRQIADGVHQLNASVQVLTTYLLKGAQTISPAFKPKKRGRPRKVAPIETHKEEGFFY